MGYKIAGTVSNFNLTGDIDSALTEKYRGLIEALNGIRDGQETMEAELAKVRATPAESTDSSTIQRARMLNSKLLDSLKGELKLRVQLEVWFSDYRKAFPTVVTARQAAVSAFLSDLNTKLSGLGFEPAKIPPRVLSDAHPALRAKQKSAEAARGHNMTLSQSQPEGDPIGSKANADRMARIRGILKEAIASAGFDCAEGLSDPPPAPASSASAPAAAPSASDTSPTSAAPASLQS